MTRGVNAIFEIKKFTGWAQWIIRHSRRKVQ